MIPVRDIMPRRRTPFVTWSLIAINVGVFWHHWSMPAAALEELYYLYGVVPMRYANPDWAAHVGFPFMGPVPFVTSLFLHGGLLHLLFNMWTLWIFGDNVEDRMGHVRFAGFYVVCGVAASLVHMAFNPGSPVPVIGASGAIAGVLGAYLLLFPFARLVAIIPILFIPVFVRVPAVVFMAFWFFMQVFSGTMSLLSPSDGGIAWWAHVGGFIAGMLLLRSFLPRRPTPPPLPAWYREAHARRQRRDAYASPRVYRAHGPG